MNKLLSGLLFISFVISGVLGAGEEEFKKMVDSCLKEHNVSEQDVIKFYDNGMKESDASKNLKCSEMCTMVKMGNLKDGKFDAATAITNMLKFDKAKGHEQKIRSAIQDCSNIVDADGCEMAYKITKCVHEHVGEI